tara:strand:- start:179 stop:730 length:552 start_codon:yes stop_codon:yes gene_type:complete
MASILKVNSIQTTTGNPLVNSTGSVLQVKQTTKTDVQSIQSTTLLEIGDLNLTITPSSASSKMLIMANPSLSGYGHLDAKITRTVNGTATDLLKGDQVGSNRTRSHWHTYKVTNFNTTYANDPAVMHYLDSPNTTSEITYKVLVGSPHDASSYIVYVNRQYSDGDNSWASTSASTLTVMEIAG